MTREPKSHLRHNLFCTLNNYSTTSLKLQLEIGENRYENSGIRWKIGSYNFIFSFAAGSKIRRKKEKFRYFTPIFNCKASNYSPIMPPQTFLLHLQFALVSTTGDAANIKRNLFLFGATASTTDPDLKEAQRQILLYAFSSLKDPDPSIAWEPYQYQSGAPLINDFLAITWNHNGNLRLQLI